MVVNEKDENDVVNVLHVMDVKVSERHNEQVGEISVAGLERLLV